MKRSRVREHPHRIRTALFATSTGAFAAAFALLGCASEPNIASEHMVEPTDEMMKLARQQCVDDLSKTQGVIEAKDPNSGAVVSRAVVDCP